MPQNRPHSRSISARDNPNLNNLNTNETVAWDRNFGRHSTSSSPSNIDNSSNATYRDHIMISADKIQRTTMASYRRANDSFRALSIIQRALLLITGLFGIGALVLFLRFGESVFAWIAPLAERWRGVSGGWMVLWLLIFVVGTPPLIGYSSCVTIAGFVYGLWKGWAIVASATILGSTFAFLLSRTIYSGFVNRLVAHDRRFAALALTLKHDGLKLLIMIRLCPLPYSLSNGALSTFNTVNWQTFMAATTIATPRLLIPVFIGSRLAKIADNIDDMDRGTKLVNWLGIIVSGVIGVTTAFLIYRQTKLRAEQLEAQERAASGISPGGAGDHDGDIIDEEYEDEEYERENENVVGNGQRYADADTNALRLHLSKNMEPYVDGARTSPVAGRLGEYRDQSSSEEQR